LKMGDEREREVRSSKYVGVRGGKSWGRDFSMEPRRGEWGLGS